MIIYSNTEKRFEMKVNQHNQCDIVDWVESKEKNAICIYNDLGDYHFSSAKALCELLNELHDENKELKAKVDDKEVAVEVECEKLMQKVFDLIEEKIEHYQKQPVLAVRIPINCEHKKSCLHNQEVNVCNKAKENAYRELKKELSE